MGDITQLLDQMRASPSSVQAKARDLLFTRVYAELIQIARQRLAGSHAPTLLEPSALVHEAYVRLQEQQLLKPGNRSEFLAYASTVMRNVVVDAVRERLAQKRGSGAQRVTLDTRIGNEVLAEATDFEALIGALDQLSRTDSRLHRIVELRYFGGLSLEEVGELEAVSLATVKRDWQKARAFLYDAISA